MTKNSPNFFSEKCSNYFGKIRFLIPRVARGGKKKMDRHEWARKRRLDWNNGYKLNFIPITLKESEDNVLIPKNP